MLQYAVKVVHVTSNGIHIDTLEGAIHTYTRTDESK